MRCGALERTTIRLFDQYKQRQNDRHTGRYIQVKAAQLAKLSNLIPRLHDQAIIKQSASKHRANIEQTSNKRQANIKQ